LEAFALVNLGISGADFWALSPARFSRLTQAWARRDRLLTERADRHVALLAATIHNMSGRTAKRARKVEDFMPRAGAPRRLAQQSVPEQLRVMQQWAAMTRGR